MQHVKIEMVASGVIAKMVLVERDSSALVWEYSLHIVYWLDLSCRKAAKFESIKKTMN